MTSVTNESVYSCWEEHVPVEPTNISEADYPSLTDSPTPKPPKTPVKPPSPMVRPRSQRERRQDRQAGLTSEEDELINGCFVAKTSYVENRQAAASKAHEADARRQRALLALGDKDKLKDRLTKTRLCRSVATNRQCPHGDKCRYAHSETDLVIPTCLFDRDCRYVEFCENGTIRNRGTRLCRQKHTGEGKTQYSGRVGLTTPAQESIREPTPMVPRQVHLAKFTQLTPSPPVEKPAPPPALETVLRVPIELAPQAMELALRAGNQLIRVEIV